MPTHRRLIIDLSLLAQNFAGLQALCPGKEVIFMVKANAYGHGLLPIAEFAFRDLGVREFGLASFAEAKLLCEHIPDERLKLYVFSDFDLTSPSQKELFAGRRVVPVIFKNSDLDVFLSDPDCKNLPLCLKFNTGMNRLGIPWEDAEKVAKRLKGRAVEHLMTHFACASQGATHSLNQKQMNRFTDLKSLFCAHQIPVKHSSCANSAAIEQGLGLEDSHLRPGLMLYAPSAKGKVISQLEGSIIQVRTVKQGELVGYGAHPAPHAGVLALVNLGYGDGFATHFSGVKITHRGTSGTVLGQVNMDMFQILFPKETPLKAGGPFCVWDDDPQNFASLCQQSNQIPYQLLCQLSARLERQYFF